MALEELDVLLRKILTDDADEIDRREEAGRHSCVGSRAAEQVGALLKGSLDGVEGDGAENE